MKRVVIESPYAGDIEANKTYLARCLRDSLRRGEAPFASHGLYTHEGVLDDRIPEERECGIKAGHMWLTVADACVVYVDRGISPGMQRAIALATAAGIPVIHRSIEIERP